jgi:HAD superfamily hydrolase (TIGR01484 family)
VRFHALACDYDGTIAHEGRVDDATIEALERVRASGRYLLLVTGRDLDDLRRVFDRFDLFDRVVAENGGLLYRPEEREEHPLTEPPNERLVELLRARGVQPLGIGRTIVATWEPNEEVVLAAIRDLGLELDITFNKGAVMVLPSGVTKASGLMAALAELQLSPHNAVGVGDAENDHAFLRLCEVSVAVGNALPAVKRRADLVMEQPRGAGVAHLADMLVGDDLRDVEAGLERIRVPLGEADGTPIGPPGHRAHVLLAGPSGGGKSTLTTAFIEGLLERGYQVCLVDPEGDYEDLPRVVALGTADRAPSIDEVLGALDDPTRSVTVNLLGMPLQDRPPFFARLLARLQDLRTRVGRPHWIVLDEAHHLLPAAWRPDPSTTPAELDGLFLITVHPDRIAPSILERVDLVAAIGADAPSTIAHVAAAAGRHVPPDTAAPGGGEGLLWEVAAAEDSSVRTIRLARPRAELRRHRRKYAAGELGTDKSFWFRGPGDRLNLRAQNLVLFVQLGEGVDDETWLFHLRRGDYSRWIRDAIKDDDLAESVAAVEADPATSAAEGRRRVRAAIEEMYTAPA